MKKLLLIPFLTLLVVGTVTAQKNLVRFKSGDYFPVQNIENFTHTYPVSEIELYQDKYFRLIQFNRTPTQNDHSELKESGIELLNYLPEKAFFAAISKQANLSQLANKGVVSVEPIQPTFKLTSNLITENYSNWALFENNRIGINASYFSIVDPKHVEAKLKLMGADIIMHNDVQMIGFTIDIVNLNNLYQLNEFYYFEEFDEPGEPEGIRDVTNHRSNIINTAYASGLKYSGKGVTIMMQDDGVIGPHIDYQGRIDHRTGTNGGNHGDHVAGIIMGAGNRDPRGVGNAPGAFLLIYGSANTNYNAVPNLYLNEEVVITSKSYSNGNNTGYTTLARQLDQQCRNYNALVHVFSAGNSGTSDFGYGAGAGWGNITGGHKQGKNVLAVGNLTHLDVLANSSSRGPAADGRIKPDICAVGSSVFSTIDPHTYDSFGGTSMACPAVAGVVGQLYEAYRSMNGGQNPNAALINAALLNTAEDLGNPGPDFRHGWGRINARKAYELLKNQHYLTDEVDQGESNTHTINVPAGTIELRVMVYWTDYEGTANSTKALVNDINITLTDPSGSIFSPWVLDPTPTVSALNNDAVRGIDDLNNVEQVTIENPTTGNYTVSVSGFNIPMGPQAYYLVYEFVQDEIILTYPIGGEGFTPGTTEEIRWDAYGSTGNFTVEYSTDEGQTWTTLNANVPGVRRHYSWIVPNALSGLAKVRVSRNGLSSESHQVFSIIRRPTAINVAWACPNSFNITWNPAVGATGYEVSLLGNMYMDSVGRTSATNLTVYANSNTAHWISVKSLGPDNAEGERAVAVQKTAGTFGCTLSAPVAEITSSCTETGANSCVHFYDISTNAGQGSVWQWYFPGGNPSTSTLENPIICYDSIGTFDVALVVRNGVGMDSVYLSNYIQISNGAPLPFVEDFEQGLMPQNWEINNPDNDITWEINTSVGGFGNSSNSVFIDNFSSNFSGNVDQLYTSTIDLSSTVIFDLTFDVAYAPFDEFQTDTLTIYATIDCGINLLELYKKGGIELATALATNNLFIPQNTQWRKETVSLNSLVGQTSVRLVFENKSGNGNVLYIDNINMSQSAENFSAGELILFPNPFHDQLNIVGLKNDEIVRLSIYNTLGELAMDEKFNAPGSLFTMNLSDFAAGVYVINILTPGKNITQKLVKHSSKRN
ncbi:MAG: S8 family serine peptidase [Flavobacteriales bacterium]